MFHARGRRGEHPPDTRPTAPPWSLGWEVAIVLAAFLLSQVLVGIAAERAGVGATDADSYVRWDSGLYLSIADRGYEFEHCHEPLPVGTTTEDWCGNAAWLPGYPWVMSGLGRLGLELADAGVLVARACHLGMLAALWIGFLRDRARAPAVLALAIAAAFPAFIYQDAVFPISMTVLSIVVSLALLSRGRFLLGGLAGAVAAFSYSTGVLLAVAGAAAILALPSLRDRSARLRAAVVYCAPIVAAWSLVLLVFEWSVGRWDAWFLTQQHYNYEAEFFVTGLWDRLYEFTQETATPRAALVQTALVAALVLAGVGAVILRWRDRDNRDVTVAAFALVFWVGPLSLGGYGALPRAEALLVPVVALLVGFRAWVELAILAVLVPLGVVMAELFFDSTLV